MEAGKSRSGFQEDHSLMTAFFLAYKWPSFHLSSQGGGRRGRERDSYKVTVYWIRVPYLPPHLTSLLPTDPMLLLCGVKASTYELGMGETHNSVYRISS